MASLLQLFSAGKHKLIQTITTSTKDVQSADKVPSTNVNGVLDPSLLDATSTPTANKIAQYDGNGRFAQAAMPLGYGKDVNLVQCSENLSAGDLVNYHTVSGASRVRKADATSGTEREARGFVAQSYTTGQTAEVFADGTNTSASGLTPGAAVFLDITAGKATTTEPVAPNMLQVVGVALTATSYDYAPETPVVRS